jgi:hypothetical protein
LAPGLGPVKRLEAADGVTATYEPLEWPPVPTGPTPESVLADGSATFAWQANGTPVQSWWLYVGSTPGGDDVRDSGQIAAGEPSRVVSGLPLAGETVRVKLWWLESGAWQSEIYPYTAPTLPAVNLSAVNANLF